MLYRVMVVDDEVLIAEGVTQMMRGIEGWELDIETASSAMQALNRLRRRHFDLILLDVQMPGMSGIELLRTLRAEGNHTMVIFLTAYPDYPYMREAVQLGSFDYVLKVEGMKALRESITRALAQQEAALTESARRLRQLSHNDARLGEARLHELFLPAGEIEESPDFPPNTRFWVVAAACLNLYGPGSVRRRSAELSLELYLSEALHLPVFSVPTDNAYSCWVIELPDRTEFPPVQAEEVIASATDVISRESGLIFNFSVGREAVPRARVASVFARLCEDAIFSETETAVRYEQTPACETALRSDAPTEAYGQLEIGALRGDPDVFVRALQTLRREVCKSGATDRARADCYFGAVQLLLKNAFTDADSLPDSLIIDEKAFSLLEELARSRLGQRREEQASRRNDTVEAVKQYISAHLNSDLSLSALAERMHVNASYLSRLFSRTTGQTLTDYVTGERIRQAAALLKTTDFQIQEIASFVGFESASYFTNVFRRKTGKSPQKYRTD